MSASSWSSRRPLLAWARQIPLGGEPAELVGRIEAYDAWLASSTSVPKLLMTFGGSPTLLMGKKMVEWCETHLSPWVGIPAFRPGGKRILSAEAAKRRSMVRICLGSGQGLAVMKLLGVE
jgi:hypothetical protein